MIASDDLLIRTVARTADAAMRVRSDSRRGFVDSLTFFDGDARPAEDAFRFLLAAPPLLGERRGVGEVADCSSSSKGLTALSVSFDTATHPSSANVCSASRSSTCSGRRIVPAEKRRSRGRRAGSAAREGVMGRGAASGDGGVY
jgi:hypothetical protein